MKDGRFIVPDRLHTVPNVNPENPDSAPSFSEHQIIPELNHDGSNVLDLSDEEDEYVGLLNDGVGEDDDGSDESGDESDEANGDPTAAPPKVRRTVKALPDWLKAQFDEKRAEAAVRSGQDRLPKLYQAGSFWFPRRDPFLQLRGQTTPTTLSPETLFQADFFLWDPLALVPIPCPNCRHELKRHDHIKRPRRCVDLDRLFWIIGYRYICPVCMNPESGRKTVTFRSWDPRIIRNLPRSLASRFPVMLSHRNGISESLFMFMRTCFQSGMGTKQFSDALRVRHLEHFDKLHLTYLWTLAELESRPGLKFKSFKAFDDTSSDGYHGFVPSSQWLRDIFDEFIETHGHDFDQAMSMLPAMIAAIDHSFKVT